MKARSGTSEENLRYETAGPEHHAGIRDIYLSTMVDHSIYDGLLSDDPDSRESASQHITACGGLLSPPDDKDMALAQDQGATIVCLQGEKVVGFNRQVLLPETVKACFCLEFRIDPAQHFESPADFQDWQGFDDQTQGKTFKRVHWADREAAYTAWLAANAHTEGRPDGGLVWALDTAVHPDFHRRGIGAAMRNQLAEHHHKGISAVASRVFELRAVNGIPLHLNNGPSTRLFTGLNTTSLYAWTEEDIALAENITLTVRWNQWLRLVPTQSAYAE
jgi:GNAT superfamily N-acetyltransferase